MTRRNARLRKIASARQAQRRGGTAVRGAGKRKASIQNVPSLREMFIRGEEMAMMRNRSGCDEDIDCAYLSAFSNKLVLESAALT